MEDGTRVLWVEVHGSDGSWALAMLVVHQPPREPAQVIDLHAAPSRRTLRGERVVHEGCCDLCADVGISTPATAEGRLPGGTWADLCEAHAYRARSAGHLVLDASADDAARAA